MYENLIFSGVETIYDYISYYENNYDDATYTSLAEVKVWDDIENKFWRCTFSCGCNGRNLSDSDGTTQKGFRMPFVKIDVKHNNDDSLYIDNELFVFLSVQDKLNFIEFANSYNSAIDKYVELGIKECFSLSAKMYNGDLALPTQNFINMLPQQFFTELNVYKAMLRDISWRDKIFSLYANFSVDEIKETYNLIHHKANEKTFQQINNLFINFANVISERVSIPSPLLKLTCFLLIRQGAIDVFSKKWASNHDVTFNYNDAESYVAKCVQNNMCSSSDVSSLAMMTYYIMSIEPVMQEDYYVVLQRIYSIVLKYENQKRQKNFEAQLFKNTSSNDKMMDININDVDLMSGDEFENIVCKLFRKMGFQAYVTKHSGDQGIDVIAEKGSLKIGIQAKCYASTVGNSAIQEAVAGRAYYGCNRVMVVTNNVFTKSAENLAAANDVVLWGRDILKEKLVEYPISR